MANIVINRFNIDVAKKDIQVSFFTKNITHYLKRKKPTYLYEDLEKNQNASEIIDWLKNLKKETIEQEQYVYFSCHENEEAEKRITIDTHNYKFKKHFIKETFLKFFIDKGFIIEPYKEGCDFCVYEKTGTEKGFDKYRRYDFVVYCYFDKSLNKHVNELSISIGNEGTHFIKRDKSTIPDSIKVLHNNILLRYEDVKSIIDNTQNEIAVKANREIRKSLNILQNPKFQFYKSNYELIDKFIKECFSSFDNDCLKIYVNFKKLDDSQIKLVSFESNKMAFRNNQLDYSPINGMRDYGPYKIPNNIRDTKLLFIYPDSEPANKLFTYFSRGYRHFPGLESYVGIPAQPAETKIKYDNINCYVPANRDRFQGCYSHIIGTSL